MKLTKTAIEKARYKGSGSDIRWDSDSPQAVSGLGCRIYPSGLKSFVVSYRHHGRKQLMVIGKVGVMTLFEARKRAREALVKVGDGHNPLAERKQEAEAGTVKQLCQAYMARYAKVEKKSWGKDESHIKRHILPAWGNLKAADLKRSDVAALHSKIGKTAPYEANRCLALVSVIFKMARIWGFVPEDHINPARDIPRFKEKSRDRFVTAQELPKLIEAIDAEESEFIRAYFHLLLLTGMRKSELLSAKWSAVDWDRQELKLPETKQGKVHYVPLMPQALAILQALPQVGVYVFPGSKPGTYMQTLSKPWSRIRERAGLQDVRVHDLRRTVGSWLAMGGSSLALIGKVLGHSNQATTQIYARFGQDAVRDAMGRHAVQITNISKGETAEIVPLKRSEG